MGSVKTLEPIAGVHHQPMPGPRTVDASMFLGAWVSTNRDTQGLAELLIREERGEIRVRAFGVCAPSLCDWGEATAQVFADSPESSKAYAFTARFDLGFKVTSFQAKIEKGVLVVANFNRFTDESGRASFFSREFFFKRPDRQEQPARAGARS